MLIVTGVFIGLLYILDTIALLSRMIGSYTEKLALYNHLSMIVLLVNRILVAIVMLFIGYMVDMGYSLSMLVISFSIATLVMLFLYFLFSLNRSYCYDLVIKALCLVHKNTDNGSFKHAHVPSSGKKSKFNHGVFFTQVFFIVGFTAPSMLAVSFSDYRATLLQSGFIINALGTLINIFIVEKGIAQLSSDNTMRHQLLVRVESIVYTRMIASIFMFSFFLFSYYFFLN